LPPVNGATLERLLARERAAEPDARREVRRRALVGLKVAVEREEYEDVLLRVRPAPAAPAATVFGVGRSAFSFPSLRRKRKPLLAASSLAFSPS
jgi:hypothetical protein